MPGVPVAVDPAAGRPRAAGPIRVAAVITAVLAFAGVALQLILNVPDDAHGYGALGEALHTLAFFTITSNALVGVVAVLRARDPLRSGPWFDASWLASLVMISVTGIIYWLLLAGDPLTGPDWWANLLTHTLTPAAAVLSWLLVGPHGRLRFGLIPRMLVIPVAWLVMAMVRGAVSEYYAYYFMDVTTLGYGAALLNLLGVVVFAMVLASAFIGVDLLVTGVRDSRGSAGS